MKLCPTILFLLLFLASGLCQDTNFRPRNAIFGSLKINQAAPAVSITYERIIIRKEQIDLGLYIGINTTWYKEYHNKKEISPSLSLGLLLSHWLNQKNKIEAMLGIDYHPFIAGSRPRAQVFINGKIAYTYFLPKAKIGFRGFIMLNQDIDYNLFLPNPALTRKQISIPTKFYWSLGVAVGKYF